MPRNSGLRQLRGNNRQQEILVLLCRLFLRDQKRRKKQTKDIAKHGVSDSFRFGGSWREALKSSSGTQNEELRKQLAVLLENDNPDKMHGFSVHIAYMCVSVPHVVWCGHIREISAKASQKAKAQASESKGGHHSCPGFWAPV